MHILAGACRPDAGRISLAGEVSKENVELPGFPDEHQAQKHGIAIVYQERSLFHLLSVAENLLVNQQPLNRFAAIDRKRLLAEARGLLAQVKLDVDPALPVALLSPAEQQMVEIAKALALKSRVLILDEPTAALTFSETETLFDIIGRLRRHGTGIIYISHRLEEIFEIADRVTVLKDGRVQGTWPVAESSLEHLVTQMVGRERFYRAVEKAPLPSQTPVLTVRGLSDEKLKDINFEVRAGEILAFAGLAGAGRSELALSVFGARRFHAGEIRVRGATARIRSPKDAMALGIGYLPEDRKEMGLFLDMSIAENIAAARTDNWGGILVRERRAIETARDMMARLHIVASSPEQTVRRLSGGNQQKVLLARWLLCDSRILIVDEPTRGVDVGARAKIYAVLRGLAASGKGIVVISSDLPEVLAISDRILVMRQGQIVAEMRTDQATEEEMMRYAATSPVPGGS